MKFVGYQDVTVLPFKQGQTVVIPKGTSIRHRGATHIAQRSYKVTIDHLLPGQSTIGIHVSQKERRRLEERGVSFERFDELKKAADVATFLYENDEITNEQRLEITRQYYRYTIPLSNPSVRWAGQGGYWSEADVNDLLEANGLRRDTPD